MRNDGIFDIVCVLALPVPWLLLCELLSPHPGSDNDLCGYMCCVRVSTIWFFVFVFVGRWPIENGTVLNGPQVHLDNKFIECDPR